MKASDIRSSATSWLDANLLSHERLAPLGATVVSALCLVAGFAALAENSADVITRPVLALLILALGALLLDLRQSAGAWDREGVIMLTAATAGLLFLVAMPEYLYGYNLNAIVHRSIFSSVILLGVGIGAFAYGQYHLLGGTPSARDVSRYPLILLPIAIALLAYGMVLGRVLDKGISNLNLDVLTHVYSQTITANQQFANQAGMRNHILGTLLIIGMTCGISLPIGIGAGIYMSEYPGWTSRVIAFSTTMLRAISVFVIAVAAFNMVDWVSGRAAGDPISDAIRGYYRDDNGFVHPGHGSFLLAAAFLSLLVAPVIARATEEGFRSVPREVRESSLALGATDGHAMTRIFLPWALPSILTGTLIGAAEAAGSVTVLLFIAGTGQYGVGPLQDATSLGFLIFQSHYGPDPFIKTMQEYQYTAALLLLVITLSLTIGALWLKARVRKRYRGIYAS